MKITTKGIEKLGFNFKVSGDDNDDLTFNKPSFKGKNWKDLIVWQPKTNDLTLSQHTNDVFKVFENQRLPKGKKIEDYIVQLYQGKVETIEELNKILIHHKVI